MAVSGRIVREYAGVLPCSRRTVKHLLRCEHLRPVAGDPSSPYQDDPNNTHQIWLWYRTSSEPERLHLVFRGQFNFAVPSQPADTIAVQITDSLAERLWESQQLDQTLRYDESDDDWSSTIEQKLSELAH
jgi:hypothetical protein